MKESTLLEMQNKIKAMTNVLQQLINENTQLRDLCVHRGYSGRRNARFERSGEVAGAKRSKRSSVSKCIFERRDQVRLPISNFVNIVRPSQRSRPRRRT